MIYYIKFMAENLAKFNSAMSQFQSGSEGINNYLNSKASSLAARAQSSIADAIGISQEDKERLDDAISMVGSAAPIGIAAVSKLKGRAFPKKVTGKGSESSATESAKGSASETGKAAEAGKTGEATASTEGRAEFVQDAESGAPEEGVEMNTFSGAQSAKTLEQDAYEPEAPGAGPGSKAEGEEGGGEEAAEGDGEEAAEGGGEAAAEEGGGVLAKEAGGTIAKDAGGSLAKAAGEDVAEAAGEGAVEAGAATAASSGGLFGFLGEVASVIPVVGEVAVAAAAGYAIYEGVKDLTDQSSDHASAVKDAFSGDIASAGESTGFTSGSYAVASNDGITTQTGGSSAF